MRTTPLLALALLASPVLPRVQAAMSADERAIWQMEFDWDHARVEADLAALEAMELPGYVLTGPDSVTITRKIEFDQLKSGSFKYRELSDHEANFRVSGSVAIVTGRRAAKVTVNGTDAEGIYAFTDTLIKSADGKWQAAATQLTKIAPTDQLAIEPLPRDYNWIKRHEKFVGLAKQGGADILFLGDSITDFWATRGKETYQKHFAGQKIVNFGISGDRTEHVLWRLQNGELAGIHPKAIMLMIGTNDIGHERDGLTSRGTPHEAAEGVKAIVGELRRQLPEAKILLLAVFPRSHLPTDPDRLLAAQINPEIAGLADGDHVRYLDFGKNFLTPDGVLEPTIMPDFLHPNEAGYEIWAQAVQGPLAEMSR